jgi:multiple sugar transport system ATP-binding protein
VVDVVEELGSESYLYAHLAEDTATKIVVRGPGRVMVRFGDPIAVRPSAEALHVFDVESGERLD